MGSPISCGRRIPKSCSAAGLASRQIAWSSRIRMASNAFSKTDWNSTLARVEGARDLTLFFLRPKQELGEQQHNGCEGRKQGKEEYGGQFSSAQSVPKGQRDEGNRDEAYGDGSQGPDEMA